MFNALNFMQRIANGTLCPLDMSAILKSFKNIYYYSWMDRFFNKPELADVTRCYSQRYRVYIFE